MKKNRTLNKKKGKQLACDIILSKPVSQREEGFAGRKTGIHVEADGGGGVAMGKGRGDVS